MAAFLPISPITPNSHWSPSTSKHDASENQSLPLSRSNRKSQEISVLTTDNWKSNQEDKDVKNIVDMLRCSDDVHIPPFVQQDKTDTTEQRPAGAELNALPSCAKVSCAVGITCSNENTGNEVHSSRSSKAKDSQVYGIPCMIKLLPSCPRATLIPGLPSLILPEEAPKWRLVEGSMTATPHKEKQAELIHNLCEKHHDIKKFRKMISLRSACPRSVSIPGFPSVPFYTVVIADTSHILSTCPEISRVFGLPSIFPVPISEAYSWHKNNLVLWERKLKCKTQILPNYPENSEISKSAFLMRPSCSTVSRISGFPSASGFKAQEHPNIVNISISCPLISSITGFASKVFLSVEQGDQQWQSHHRMPLFVTPKKHLAKLIHDLGSSHHDIRPVRNMVSLRQTCPKAAIGPGFPSVPFYVQKVPNVAKLLPTCPTTSNVFGLPSRLPVMEQEDKSKCRDSLILWERQLRKTESNILLISTNDLETVKPMILMSLSCSVNSGIPGFPSATKPIHQKHPSIVNMFASCPDKSKMVGFPSKMVLSANQELNEEWKASKNILIGMTKKEKLSMDIISPQAVDNIDFKQTMVALVPTCPAKAHAPGFPSVPTHNKQSSHRMIGLLTSCPKASCVLGMPALDTDSTSFVIWPMDTEPFWVKEMRNFLYCSKFSYPPQYDFTNDKYSLKSMALLKPSCPRKVKLPGFPSVPKLRHQKHPHIVNMLGFCPNKSKIVGFPSILVHSKDQDVIHQWRSNKNLLIGMPEKQKSNMNITLPQFMDTFKENIDPRKTMVALVPTCPRKALSPGFPSVPNQNKETSQGVIGLLNSCPKTSCVLGMPALNMESASSDIWPMDTEPFWVKEMRNHQHCCKLSYPSQYKRTDDEDRIKSMALLMPSCPRKVKFPGFPSAPLLTSKPVGTHISLCFESASISILSLTHVKDPIQIPQNEDITPSNKYICKQKQPSPKMKQSTDRITVMGMTCENVTQLDPVSMEENKNDMGFLPRSDEKEKGILESG